MEEIDTVVPAGEMEKCLQQDYEESKKSYPELTYVRFLEIIAADRYAFMSAELSVTGSTLSLCSYVLSENELVGLDQHYCVYRSKYLSKLLKIFGKKKETPKLN